MYVQNKTNYYQLSTVQSMQKKKKSKKRIGYNKKNFFNTTWNKYIRKQQYPKFRYCFVYYNSYFWKKLQSEISFGTKQTTAKDIFKSSKA